MSKAKALESWRPPANAGMAIGCLTTTYGVNMDLLHKHALGGFLAVDADPEDADEEFLFHIAFEEAAAQCEAIICYVDGAHVESSIPSWRLDVVPVREVTFHPKISLLVWEKHIRILVGSNNLTNDGYRHNREHFAALNFHAGGLHRNLFESALDWFEALGTAYCDSATLARQRTLIDAASRISRSWKSVELEEDMQVQWAFTGPSQPTLWDQLLTILKPGEVWSGLNVISPFYAGPDVENRPMQKLVSLPGSERAVLRILGRGTAYDVLGFEGPESLRSIARAAGFRPQFYVSNMRDEVEKMDRPLHAKLLILQGQTSWVAIHGSSNFTNQGWGFSGRPNIEANLIVSVSASRGVRKMMDSWWNECHGIHIDELPRFRTDGATPGDDRPEDKEVLPVFFQRATWTGTAEKPVLNLCFNLNHGPPSTWVIQTTEGEGLITAYDWRSQDSRSTLRLKIAQSGFRHVLRVVGPHGEEWLWPVAVEDHAQLPIPEELSSLDLDDLMRVFADNLSMRSLLKRMQLPQREESSQQSHVAPELDPHRRVDTTGFILQRTRRLSYAFDGLKRRLSRLYFTEHQLEWSMQGPISPISFARAILKEQTVADEAAFSLAELALELSEVQVVATESSLSITRVKEALREAIADIQAMLPNRGDVGDKGMWSYVQRTFQKAMQHVSH